MSGPLDRPTPSPEALASLRDQITKLCREIGSLKGEVDELNGQIGGFAKGRRLRPLKMSWPPQDAETTPEPRSQIEEALWRLKQANTFDELTLLLRAISRDLDGALRDIRSAKLDLRAVSDDSDLKDEFRAWKDQQG